MGGICHLVMLAPCMIGLVLNIVLFFAEKQSRAVRQQALQAALLPVVLLLIGIGLSVLGLLVLVAVGREFAVFGLILIYLFGIIAMLGHWAGQIILAVFAFMGKPKKLPLLGDLIESISGL